MVVTRPLADARVRWLVAAGDDALVLGHRLSEWCSRAPQLEEDIALANLALDLIGQARALYQRACVLEGLERTEDDLAFRRSDSDFWNVLLVEQPNGNFADTMVRHFLFTAYAVPFYQALSRCADDELAAIGARAAQEMAYHARHAAAWVERLGNGTALSHQRTQGALEQLWPYVDECFETQPDDDALVTSGFAVDRAALRPAFDAAVRPLLARLHLRVPADIPAQNGGRAGRHSEHLSYLVGTMQVLVRREPEAVW